MTRSGFECDGRTGQVAIVKALDLLCEVLSDDDPFLKQSEIRSVLVRVRQGLTDLIGLGDLLTDSKEPPRQGT